VKARIELVGEFADLKKLHTVLKDLSKSSMR
jgi:hypothetical protein